MAQSKATKKFERNKLKDTLTRRKDFAKIKQRHQVNTKRKEKNAKTNAKDKDNAAIEDAQASERQKKNENKLEDMSVDAFFAGDFDMKAVPSSGAGAKRLGKRKRDDSKKDGDNSSVASVEDHAFAAESAAKESGSQSGEQDDAIGLHQNDLRALQAKDPEFYKYLKENDVELLDFAESSNLDEVNELSEDDVTDEPQSKKAKKSKGVDAVQAVATDHSITTNTVKKWALAMNTQKSLRALREVVLAFRAAAHLNEEDGKEYKYTISDADVYHEVLMTALKFVPEVLNHHLPIKEAANGKLRLPTDTKKYKTLSTLLKSHATSLQHLLENLSDEATLKMTLKSLLGLLPYLLSFKKLIRDLARVVVEIWSDSARGEATRISAFLVLRRLTVIGDPSIREVVLRATYQGLIKGSRTTTVHNNGGINLMKNSALELWGLVDSGIAYTTGFTFIRQLAIHLRNSIKTNANDSYKTVYNWQYVHSLDFWSRVLSTHCEVLHEASMGQESPLRPLIYPLTQITLGAMRLIPTAAYFPLRFQLIRSLLRLSQATNTFIPLAAPLYEVLTSAEMKKPPKPSTIKALEFDINIRAAKGYLRTRTYQDGIGEQVAELLAEFFCIWSKSIAFPELALPIIVMLKRWAKEVAPHGGSTNGHTRGRGGKRSDASAGGNRNGKVNSAIALVVQKLDTNARWIEERRLKVDFAPNDRAGVEGFLKDVEWRKTPLGAFVDGQRKTRQEKRTVLEASRAEEEKKRRADEKERQDAEIEVDAEGFQADSDDGSEPGEEDLEDEVEREEEPEEEDEIEDEDDE